MPSFKGKHEHAVALMVARQVVKTLEPFCERMAICGSIRRRRTVVGDVDIVAVLKDREGFGGAMADLGGSMTTKEAWALIDSVSVDISFVSAEVWGAALCHYTGPMEENVRLRAIAKVKGLKLSQLGLVERESGRLVAGATEQSIYAALGVPYVEPAMRDVSCGRVTDRTNSLVLLSVPELTEPSRL